MSHLPIKPNPLSGMSNTATSTAMSTTSSNGSQSKLLPIAPLIAPKPPANNPTIITSKQWVLPPRPKAGRKPAERKNSMNSLSNNISNLQISTEIQKKNELELATEENLKLKNIIQRLKIEIESLKNLDEEESNIDLSPTINPTIIQNVKKAKRPYKKKTKKHIEDSPSPISLNELNKIENDLPNIDQILNNDKKKPKLSKKKKNKKKDDDPLDQTLLPLKDLDYTHFTSSPAVHSTLSRTTTLNTVDTLDTVDTVDTLDTFDIEETSWLDNHVLADNPSNVLNEYYLN